MVGCHDRQPPRLRFWQSHQLLDQTREYLLAARVFNKGDALVLESKEGAPRIHVESRRQIEAENLQFREHFSSMIAGTVPSISRG